MIGTLVPAAARSCEAIDVTLILIPAVAVATQATGLDCSAHGTTSLPPMETVMSPMWPCAGDERVAAVICVAVG